MEALVHSIINYGLEILGSKEDSFSFISANDYPCDMFHVCLGSCQAVSIIINIPDKQIIEDKTNIKVPGPPVHCYNSIVPKW